jgi:4-amino-4-deoxy-L-arabinose transferase-like glycosyltransferase
MIAPKDSLSLAQWQQRLLAGGLGLWLIAMTGWYWWTVVKVVRQGLSIVTGRSVQAIFWAALALGLMLLISVVGSHLLRPHYKVTAIWLTGIILLGGLLILLSGQFLPFIITVWLLLLAYLWGDWLLQRMRVTWSAGLSEHYSIVLSLGVVLLAMIGLALGLAQALSRLWIWLTLLVLTCLRQRALRDWIASLRPLRAQCKGLLERRFSFPEQGILIVLLGCIVLFNLVWALAPETRFDALNYQLAVPRIYLEQHRFVDLPYFWHSYFSRMANMLYVIALGLHGQIVAKLLMLAMGLIAALGVYALGCLVASQRVGLWAAALFYSTPLVCWLSTTAYIDLILTVFLLGSLLALLRWKESGSPNLLWVSGLLAGAALGAKLTAYFYLAGIGLVLLIILLLKRQLSLRARVLAVAGYVLGFLLVSLPWFAITFSFTGNPVFPFLNAIFKSPGWPLVNTNLNAEVYGIGGAPSALLRLPFAFTFQSQLFDELMPPGGIGLALVLLPLGLVLLGERRRIAWLLFALCFVFLSLWATKVQYGRYYIPLLPVVIVLAVAGVFEALRNTWLRQLSVPILGLIIVAQSLIIPFMFGNIISRGPWKLLARMETQEEYLARVLPPYPGVQYLNKVVQPGQQVIGVGVEEVRFYLNAPLVTYIETIELQNLTDKATEQKMAADFYRQGYRYLLVNHNSPSSKSALPFLKPSFLEKFAVLEFSHSWSQVYRLLETEAEPGSK